MSRGQQVMNVYIPCLKKPEGGVNELVHSNWYARTRAIKEFRATLTPCSNKGKEAEQLPYMDHRRYESPGTRRRI